MSNILVQQMSQFTKLTDEEALAIEESFPIKTFEKDTLLLRQGQIAKEAYFVIDGCIRKYHYSDNEERTLDFYTEGDSAADFNSIANQKPSNYSFICTEKTTLATVNPIMETALYLRFPRFEKICRVEFEKMMGGQMEASTAFALKNPEEKYLQLLSQKPHLLQRVPQYQIASYIGITPETLSRIRKRITTKN